MWFLIFIFAILLVAGLLLPLKCKLYIDWSIDGGTAIKVEIMKKQFKIGKPQDTRRSAKRSAKMSLKEVEVSISNILEGAAEIKRRLVIENVEIYIEIGLGDAGATGMATGAAWAVIFNLLSVIKRHFILKNKKTNVIPNFSENKIDAVFSVVLSIRVYSMLLILNKLTKRPQSGKRR